MDSQGEADARAAETLALTRALVRRPSLTPDDAGCQDMIAERLARCGFAARRLDCAGVSNLWLKRGAARPLLVFAGHTDVVPTGDEAAWRCPPFAAAVEDGLLYGRGAADMKAGVAAMTVACEAFTRAHPQHPGSLALLLTSDEEGEGLHGTRHALAELDERIDWCVVGEPSSAEQLGDTLRHGRRGSLSGELLVRGRQGHVAYPEKVDNPIHAAAAALARLSATRWDDGNADFPPTTFQLTDIHAGVGADNVVPGELRARFNFRFSPESDAASLRARVEALFTETCGARCELAWNLSAEPFVTSRGALIDAALAAVRARTGLTARLSTGGGTSDARFVAPTGAEVVEFGPVNATIHSIDEHVRVADLAPLADIYADIAARLLLGAS